ncbi:MAG TPA: MotA/TolQ/ExbB proton channel family protein, partial [Pseudomonadales bacterium]|nr:MotA/TolQ/ExbB proton channel family protein [Pseudomonadales bacterium]
LHLNGAEVAAGEAALPAVQDEVLIGEGLRGLLDELQIASDLRSVDWIRLAVGAQGVESRLLAVRGDEEVASEAGEVSYMGILVSNLTTDAWVVIVLLMVMLAIAVVVMVAKARLVSVTDKENRLFLRRFRDATDDFLDLEKQGASHAHSSLYRLYQAAVREVMKRGSEQGGINLSNASISAIKAAVDADLVRESHRLNAQMVLLTIAISGGPFLGLLGTVVGVMITFAAIAAAGDVNVNAIAPGIAAALLATVAGLAVAIPALFGYNYLASRIKNISADMQIFVDELITRIAESHSH